MKNLSFFFVIISNMIFCQGYISNKDFVVKGNISKVEKVIKTENGDNEIGNTKLFIGQETADKKDAVFYNKMIATILVKAKFTLKNTSSFKPNEISIYQDGADKWIVHTKFSGTNDYGGRKDSVIGLNCYADLNCSITYRSPEL